ncbi:MAG: glycosyltransferase family 39 protein [Synergistaceae bacterium]|nr:glycosyltransferase family 39 protein [Synergistaceae bacterium]
MKLSLLKNKFNLNNKDNIILCVALLISLLVRIFCKDILSIDMSHFLIPWYKELSLKSLHRALVEQVGNYNVTYQLLIYMMTKFPGEAIYKYKILSCVFDYAMAFGIYSWLHELLDKRRAVIGFVLALLLPTIWLNSAAWGQCDSIYVCFIIWSLYMLQKNKVTASFVLLGFAFVFKLQTIFILPFFCYYYWKNRANGEQAFSIFHFCIIPLVMLVASMPQILAGRSFADTFAIYLEQTGQYNKMFMNYPSIWGLLSTDHAADSRYATIITAVILLGLMYWFHKCKAKVIGKHFVWIAFIFSYTCVLFLPAMHDRYGFLYEVLAIPLVLSVGRGWLLLIGLQLLSLKTYSFLLCRESAALGLQFLSWINLAIYITALIAFHKELNNELSPSSALLVRNEEARFDNGSLRNSRLVVSRLDYKIMALLTVIFVIIGSFHLGSRNTPKSFCHLEASKGQSPETTITFFAEEDVEAIDIYTGIPENQSVLVYIAKDGNWQLIQNTKLTNEFAWNKIKINARTHQVSLVFPDEKDKKSMIGEIVCLKKDKRYVKGGNNGGVIELAHVSHYPELFDEQDCYPIVPLVFYSDQYIPPSYYDQTLPDEVYHVRTAYEFLHGMPMYKNVYPPLGQILISMGIALFGMNPFGWRIMCLVFGVLMVPIIYLFALRFTRKTSLATLAALLLVTEFMHYSLSRMAMIEIIAAFFILCMFYSIYAFIQEGKNKYLFLSGIAFACGIATKWTAIHALFALVIIIAWYMLETYGEKANFKPLIKLLGLCLVYFCLIPAVVYVLSYIPLACVYSNKGLIEYIISNLKYCVTESHLLASPWWSWLFDWQPVLESYVTIGNTHASVVSIFINPLICFLGIASLGHHFYLSFVEKNKTAVCLLVCYLAMLVPWIFIARLAPIYQYFCCINILILMICNSIYSLNFKQEDKIIKIVGVISVGLFILFFPVISGTVVNNYHIEQVLEWWPNWVL